jgi:hypothetical protein
MTTDCDSVIVQAVLSTVIWKNRNKIVGRRDVIPSRRSGFREIAKVGAGGFRPHLPTSAQARRVGLGRSSDSGVDARRFSRGHPSVARLARVESGRGSHSIKSSG